MNDRRPAARESLARLIAGNERFVQHLVSVEVLSGHLNREKLLGGQHPRATVLGCSDSRAPAELVFNQGLGDLFVIRVAGNVVAPSIIGSVEYAASQLEVPLVVVMGHTLCGAVKATLQALSNPAAEVSPNIRDIVQRIRPAVEAFATDSRFDNDTRLDSAIRANILRSAEQLQHGSPIVEEMVASGAITIVPALYHLDGGQVEILADPAER